MAWTTTSLPLLPTNFTSLGRLSTALFVPLYSTSEVNSKFILELKHKISIHVLLRCYTLLMKVSTVTLHDANEIETPRIHDIFIFQPLSRKSYLTRRYSRSISVQLFQALHQLQILSARTRRTSPVRTAYLYNIFQ